MRPLTAFAIVLVVVLVLATGLFFAVSWFGLSDLSNIPAQVSPSGGPSIGGPGGDPLVATINSPSGSSMFATIGQSISFSGSASGGTSPYSFAWSFGDGSTSNSANPSKSYSEAGTYNALFAVVDMAGASASDSIQIIVSGASFSASITAPSNGAALTVGQNTTFTATASGGVGTYHFSWEFGDGNIGTGPGFPYAYSTAGNYTVTMRVSDSGSPPTEITKTIQVSASAPAPELLQASITSPAAGAVFYTNQAVSFTGSATGGSGSYIYRWAFGDGGTAFQQNASHTFSQAGTYTVELLVSDNAGHQDTASMNLAISGGVGPPSGGGGVQDNNPPPSLPEPLAASIDNPSNNAVFQVGQTVSFSGSADGGNSPYRYRWEFGDGGSSANRNPAHVYNQAGSRTVSLRVTDDDDETDTTNISISIQAASSGGGQNPPDNDPPGGGGGGGGGGGYHPPTPPTPPVIPTPVVPTVPLCTTTGSNFPALVGPFSFGMRDNPQVTLLQRLLATDSTIYPEGIVSGFYGPLTREAVKRFQIRYGILTPASDPELLGFAGPQTRAKINQVLGGAAVTCVTPTSPSPVVNVPVISPEETRAQARELIGQLASFANNFRSGLLGWLVTLGSFLTP